ncbi:hypothetical protein GCM10022378_19840 [Salinicoccus jeotgali]|uniref:Uncharacterized protein n=1 Tax=Salinicoccus jeotgali TaxID=381634 RepID=A0ABP7F644_9STAP
MFENVYLKSLSLYQGENAIGRKSVQVKMEDARVGRIHMNKIAVNGYVKYRRKEKKLEVQHQWLKNYCFLN